MKHISCINSLIIIENPFLHLHYRTFSRHMTSIQNPLHGSITKSTFTEKSWPKKVCDILYVYTMNQGGVQTANRKTLACVPGVQLVPYKARLFGQQNRFKFGDPGSLMIPLVIQYSSTISFHSWQTSVTILKLASSHPTAPLKESFSIEVSMKKC